MIDFSEQVVIVTGAGRGMGRLFALDFARRGARVVVNDLGGSMSGSGADKSVADVAVEEIARAGGLAVSSHDSVASPEGAEAIVSAALKHSACAGRYARVFSGLGAGWIADSTRKPNAEDIAKSFDKISKVEPFLIPESTFDEIGDVCQQLKIDLE